MTLMPLTLQPGLLLLVKDKDSTPFVPLIYLPIDLFTPLRSRFELWTFSFFEISRF